MVIQHYGNKTKNRFVEIDLEKLKERLSVEGGYSSINHPDEPGLGRLLSALTDSNNLTLSELDVNQKMTLENGTTYGFGCITFRFRMVIQRNSGQLNMD